MEGWIKLHRILKKWEWFQDSKMVHLFLYLLLSANNQESLWKGHRIRRGQLICSLATINRQTRISVRSIRTCLSRLKSTSEITNHSTNKFRLITILNYEKYQCNGEKSTSNLTSNLTNKRQTSDKQATTNKKDKEYIKNIKKRESNLSPLEIMNEFISSKERQLEIIDYLIKKDIPKNIALVEINKFIAYWTEPSPSGNKQRWEMEKTFELSRRLTTWFSRINNFNSSKNKIIKI